ncbi:MAG TPA: sulfatase, partial [Verrucomicrobiales bacterium]|nr:sulfatase [Verrucomicrobiales bacterium]
QTEHHGNATYAAMIESVDQSVGQVLKKLDTLELTERTVIIFTSDNGGHGRITSHLPL